MAGWCPHPLPKTRTQESFGALAAFDDGSKIERLPEVVYVRLEALQQYQEEYDAIQRQHIADIIAMEVGWGGGAEGGCGPSSRRRTVHALHSPGAPHGPGCVGGGRMRPVCDP